MKLPLLLLLVSCAPAPAGSGTAVPAESPVAGSSAAPADAPAETTLHTDAWTAAFDPPTSLDTPRVHLEVLGPAVADLDYAAFMSSRDHLQRTLHWGSWPSADATLEDNRNDLARHRREFDAREAYAYTVLTPDRSECVGCIYLNPSDAGPRTVRMAYWVVERELATDLDEHLLAAVFGWIESDWPFDTLVLSLHEENERGIRIAADLGLELRPETVEEHRELSWQR